MRATVNRVVLALVGLALVLAGAAVLCSATGLLRRPYTGRDDVLLSGGDRSRYEDSSWWWPVVIGVLALLVLGALWWLLAQVRDRRLRRLAVDADDDGVALLRGRALEEIIAADAEQLHGVDHATTALMGTPTAPRARLQLALSPHAVPGDVLAGLDSAVLDRARVSAGLPRLPAEARLRAVSHRAARVS
ncbi:alkaline shock response membrane anchor protein AmaP [Streptomyces sp. PA03-1a]|nr:alkaline shock response membrane anchor protein AmaP [Streptomyces sp. PA03-1a]MDX2815466.1 alkaline shock response membrane anchor protein AmaP [Streptomyces sp. PA03-5A]